MSFLYLWFNAVFALKEFLKVNRVHGFVKVFAFVTLCCKMFSKQGGSFFVRYVSKQALVCPVAKAKMVCSEHIACQVSIKAHIKLIVALHLLNMLILYI